MRGPKSTTLLIRQLKACDAIVAVGLLTGCTAELAPPPSSAEPSSGLGGREGGSAAGPAAPSSTASGACDSLTTRRLRRLSSREYQNVVSDLLGPTAAAAVATALPFEPRLRGFDNQDSALFVSASFHEAITNVAEKLAAAADPAALAPCPDGSPETTCLESFAGSFAARAYGRPLTEDELARMRAVAATGQDYAGSVRLVVELVLQSPHFVYLSELGATDAAPAPMQAVPLTSYEMASQLSFLLRGSRPDDALRELAGSGGLTRPEDIEREAARLLADPRALGELRRYVLGWLDMEDIAEAPKSPDLFPDLTDEVVSAMQQELDDFVVAQLEDGEGTISGFLTATPRTVAPELFPIYGADYDPVRGFDPERRAGVLSLPGVLTYHASYQHSGPVERGLFVRRQLLCNEIPPPPASVLQRIVANPIEGADETRTTRQKYQQHLDEAFCSGCHQQFDPIGFGLEEMDGIGRYRTMENGLPVDSTGALSNTDVDGPFEGVAQLSAKLAQSQRIEACAVEHFFRFAMARPVEAADACVVDEWAAAFSEGGGKINDLVPPYVTHVAFATRRDDR